MSTMTTAALSQPADSALVASAVRGDTRAYEALVCRHWEGLVQVVYRMCGDPALAEEAAQEAFIRAWQRLETYKPEHAFRAWVYRIAVNAALDALRSRKPTGALDEVVENSLAAGAESDPEAVVVRRQRVERIQRAVMDLPPASRSVLVLREWGQLSYSEIAEALSIPLGTVMSRLNSARGLLRKSLAEVVEAV
jgi:RNA polymerase sigma-70 factor (ECF subfamily)